MNLGEELSFLLPFTMLTFGIVFLVVGWRRTVSARFWGFGYLAAGAGFFVPVALMHDRVKGQALVAEPNPIHKLDLLSTQ